MAGTEPSDGLRVVNALLTQLDKLKHRKNVLVMSTSNLAKAIDSAFVDRADIIQYIDLPPREAIYEILRTCLLEMIGKGIVKHVQVPTLKEAQMYELAPSSEISPSRCLAGKLSSLASLCRKQGMSGRALRRLPVLALARYIGIGFTVSSSQSAPSVASVASSSLGSRKGSLNGDVKNGGIAKDAGNGKTLKVEGGGADVEIWLDGMEKVIIDSGEEVKRFVA